MSRGVTVPGTTETEPTDNRVLAFARQARDGAVQRWRDRQRKKAARGRKRGFSRALLLLLAILLGLFFWSLHGIFTAGQSGRQISLDELTALAANHRVTAVTLRDVDNRVVGSYVAGSGATGVMPNLPASSPINDPLSSGRFFADYPQSAPLTA